MAAQLSSLRVTADFDASGYQAGMGQKVAADKAGIASSEQLVAEMAKQDVAANNAGGTYGRLSRTYIDGYGTAAKFHGALASLQRQVELGNVTAGKAGLIYQGMIAKFGMTADAAEVAAKGNAELASVVNQVNSTVGASVTAQQAHNNALGIGAGQFASLLHAGRGSAEMLAQGVPITQVAAMEMNNLAYAMMGPQGLIAAFGQIGPKILQFVIGPFGLIAGAAAVAAVAGVTMFSHWASAGARAETMLKETKSLVDDIAKSYKSLGYSIEEASKKLEDMQKEQLLLAQLQFPDKIREALQSAYAQNPYLDALGKTPFFGGIVQGAAGLTQGVSGMLSKMGVSPEVIKTYEDFQKAVVEGTADVVGYRRELALLAEKYPTEANLKFIDSERQHTDVTKGLTEQQQKVNALLDFMAGRATAATLAILGLSKAMTSARQAESASMEAYKKWADEQERSLTSIAKHHAAALAAIKARTPAEKVAAIAAQAEADAFGSSDGAEVRRAKERAATTELTTRLIEEETRALEDRKRAMDASVASAQFELTLVGKSVAEQTRLRQAYELTKAAQDAAFKEGHDAPLQSELDKIKETAAALGQLAEQAAKLKIVSDIQFNTGLLGLSQEDVAIATQLRSIYADIGKALASPEAALIRIYNRQKEINQLSKDMVSSLGSAFEGLFNGSIKSADQFFDTLTKGIADVEAKFISSKLVDWFNGGANPFAGVKAANDNGAAALNASAVNLKGAGSGLVTAAAALDRSAVSLASATSSISGSAGHGVVSTVAGLTDQMARAAQAIKNIESSGGNYGAIGPITRTGDRAYGAYQVMGANISAWTKESLGFTMTAGQFLKDRAAQDKVFAFEFGKLVDKFGNYSDAASAWFTGKPLARGGNLRDVNGMSGNAYVDRFNADMGGGAVPRGAPVNVTTPNVNLGVSGGQGASLGNFLRSPGFASAIGGFSMGYQQQSPVMGGLSGALGGFMQGGLTGGIFGLIGGIFGGILGAAKKAKEEAEAAKQAWGQLKPEVDKFKEAALGPAGVGGALTQNVKAINDEADKLIEAAKKANVGYADIEKARQDQIAEQAKRFGLTFKAMIGDLSAGLGPNGAGLQAAQNILSIGDALQAMIRDFQAYAFLHRQNFGPGEVGITDPVPPVRARAAALEYAKRIAEGLDPSLTPIEEALLKMKASADPLKQILIDLGLSAEEAGRLVDEGLNKQLQRLTEDFKKGIAARLNAATGQDWKNQIDAINAQRVADLRDIRALGLSHTVGYTTYQAELNKAFRDSFGVDMLLVKPAELSAIQQAAKSLKDARDALVYLGVAADTAAGRFSAALGKLQAEFTGGLQERLNAANDNGWINQVNDLLAQHTQDLADAAAVGLGDTLVNQVFGAELQKLIDDAGLVGDSFDEFMMLFPDLASTVHQSSTVINGAITSIQEYLDGLKTGPLSALSPQDQLAEARASFYAQLTLAQSGNADAYSAITKYADTYLNESRDYNASNKAYADTYAAVTAALEQLTGGLSGHVMGGPIAGYAGGGVIGNGTWNRDSVVARYAGGGNVMLAGGEYLVRAPAVAANYGLLDAINRGTAPAAGNDNGPHFDRLAHVFANGNQALIVTTAEGLAAIKLEVAQLRADLAVERQPKIAKRQAAA